MIAEVLRLYKRWISPALHSVTGAGGACRFVPTCSEYAATSIELHGTLHGSMLAIWRLLRCQPLSRGGFDPVPIPHRPTTQPPDCVSLKPSSTGSFSTDRKD